MQNLSRRSIKALEASTHALRRDTAAKQKATRALLDLMRQEDEADQSASASPLKSPPPQKKQPPRK